MKLLLGAVVVLTFLLILWFVQMRPVGADCCEIAGGSCASPVTAEYCEQTLGGTVHQNEHCDTTTGLCS